MASVKFLTEFAPALPSRFLPFTSFKQKQRSGIQIQSQAKQLACFPKQQNPL
ncbi:MAG: hypothetical protein II726_02365 [Elusimicrobiaceae bacterium]|nr:hypothetical protein [Elusimicrobiaceae bacterium]